MYDFQFPWPKFRQEFFSMAFVLTILLWTWFNVTMVSYGFAIDTILRIIMTICVVLSFSYANRFRPRVHITDHLKKIIILSFTMWVIGIALLTTLMWQTGFIQRLYHMNSRDMVLSFVGNIIYAALLVRAIFRSPEEVQE